MPHTISTPCPTRPSFTIPLSQSPERTAEIDYTTEIRAALRQAAARRRGTRVRREGVVVFEDSVASAEAVDGDVGVQIVGSDSQGRGAREGVSGNGKEVATVREEMAKLRKEPRRRTIYVPSEDTTIMTIHPGVRADARLSALRPEMIPHNRSARNRAEVGGRGLRMSLAVAPKRVPLQLTSKVVQEYGSEVDKMGMGGGKENIPPGDLEVFDFGKSKAACATDEAGLRASQKQVCTSPKPMRTLPPRTLAPQSKSVQQISEKTWSLNRVTGLYGRQSTMVDEHVSGYKKNAGRTIGSCASLRLSRSPTFPETIPKLPTRLAPLTISTTIPVSKPQYRLLQEDISRPELFEDTWLSDQESAITQLVNGLFDAASEKTSRLPDAGETRRRFLGLYEEPTMVLLYKRLQTSLLYGALRIPKDSLAEVGRLATDIGLRRRFVELWTKSYNIDALISAVEVVVGREVPSDPIPTTGTGNGDRHSKKRRQELERFLDACLLQNEDLQPTYQKRSCNSLSINLRSSQDPQSNNSTYHRTTLRSLMLILLLDRAKQTSLVPSKLFIPTGPHKSSHTILLELSTLLPSLGDPTRTLSHLDYHLSHTQYPLDEYAYPIQNLAIDLRDGVRLTHLVELLLYPPARLQAQREDVTITMPTGQILTSNLDHEGGSWVLSQHLRFPGLGRAQKVYNVEIALSALRGIKGIEHALEGLKAEDIVDGHREKSIKLLWGLVGKFGLATLVDFVDLRREVRRLRRVFEGCSRVAVDEKEDGDERESLRYQTELLYAWACAVAAKHGINVSNLTTSFADGNIFSKIVEEYSRYHPFSPIQPYYSPITSNFSYNSHASIRSSLDIQLRNIGCSVSFASLFSQEQGSKIFDKDFTVAALAFLASRLMGVSKKGRAGCVIWGAWRRYQNRMLTRRKHVLGNLAKDCAKVVQTKESVDRAAGCVQRAVRTWLARRERRRRVEGNWARILGEAEVAEGVLDLQNRIRGWAARRRLDEVDIWMC